MRVSRSVRQTTGGSDPTGLTGAPSLVRHVLTPVQEDGLGHRSWIGGCSCGITVRALEATTVAARLQDHLERVRSSASSKPVVPSKSLVSSPVPSRRTKLAGSVVVGELRSTNPGWVLVRRDGLDLRVDVTRVVKPALLSGAPRSWRIVEKRDGIARASCEAVQSPGAVTRRRPSVEVCGTRTRPREISGRSIRSLAEALVGPVRPPSRPGPTGSPAVARTRRRLARFVRGSRGGARRHRRSPRCTRPRRRSSPRDRRRAPPGGTGRRERLRPCRARRGGRR